MKCPVCQISKAEHVLVPGLLDPLPILDMAWQHITMDFVEGLPKSKGKDVILVVVDRLTKYAEFIALSHPYSVPDVAQAFLDNVFKHHGLPTTIISDQDRIFTSKLWRELFAVLKVTLHYNTSYHPQTDGQSERVNQCLENYLRCMTFQEPQRWLSWLSLAQYWYNTSFHTSLKMSPFQALYGYLPPQVSELSVPGHIASDAATTLFDKETILKQLKKNLQDAQVRMKMYADKNRSDREFQVGDMVYLKMQPYRETALGLLKSLKLASKFYGPFKILARVGKVAYRLLLLAQATIHPVFHVSQLKRLLGSHAVPNPTLPLLNKDGKIMAQPLAILDRHLTPRHNAPVVQWLIHWLNFSPEDATWEDASFIRKTFPTFHP